jgi:hypothetical protein
VLDQPAADAAAVRRRIDEQGIDMAGVEGHEGHRAIVSIDRQPQRHAGKDGPDFRLDRDPVRRRQKMMGGVDRVAPDRDEAFTVGGRELRIAIVAAPCGQSPAGVNGAVAGSGGLVAGLADRLDVVAGALHGVAGAQRQTAADEQQCHHLADHGPSPSSAKSPAPVAVPRPAGRLGRAGRRCGAPPQRDHRIIW